MVLEFVMRAVTEQYMYMVKGERSYGIGKKSIDWFVIGVGNGEYEWRDRVVYRCSEGMFGICGVEH